MREKDRVLEYARECGYDTVSYKGVWNDYHVYEPDFYGIRTVCVGLPLSILVNDDEIRLTTADECFEVLDALTDEEAD